VAAARARRFPLITRAVPQPARPSICDVGWPCHANPSILQFLTRFCATAGRHRRPRRPRCCPQQARGPAFTPAPHLLDAADDLESATARSGGAARRGERPGLGAHGEGHFCDWRSRLASGLRRQLFEGGGGTGPGLLEASGGAGRRGVCDSSCAPKPPFHGWAASKDPKYINNTPRIGIGHGLGASRAPAAARAPKTPPRSQGGRPGVRWTALLTRVHGQSERHYALAGKMLRQAAFGRFPALLSPHRSTGWIVRRSGASLHQQARRSGSVRGVVGD
jgi:hypothetical protein